MGSVTQSTGPSAVAQTITTQLSQNAVVLGFGVMLGSGRVSSPIEQLANGPLSAVSAASWTADLLRVRQNDRFPMRAADYHTLIFKESKREDHDRAMNNWVATMAMIVGNWALGALGMINHLTSESWSWWYVVACIAFMIAELCRYGAAYITYKGTKCIHATGDHLYYTGIETQRGNHDKQYVKVSNRNIELARSWTAFAGPIQRTYQIKGFMGYSQIWSTPLHAAASLLMCMISAVAALTYMASIVLSGANDVVTGVWCLTTSTLAAGLYQPLPDEPIINEEEILQQATIAAQVAMCFPNIPTLSYTLDLRKCAYLTILFPGERVKLSIVEQSIQLPTVDKEIDMHRIMQTFVLHDKAWQRVCLNKTTNGNGIWLEIADFMYTSMLVCVKHDATCRAQCGRIKWPGTCSNTVVGISSMALAVAHHVQCEEVVAILNNLRDYMEVSTFRYVLADAVGLEQIAMSEVREKIRHTNPATAATNAVLMRWFGDTMEVSDPLETLIIVAYLLNDPSVVLGNSMCTAVEMADMHFDGAVIQVSPGHMLMQAGDVTLEVHVAMHTWPALCPPQITEYAGSDQPYLYAFILLSMLRPQRTLTGDVRDTSQRFEEIVDDLDIVNN